MVAWAVLNMGGEIPKQDPRLLADNMAAAAWNTDLVAGPLDSLPFPELVKDLTGMPGADTAQRVYRLPAPDGVGSDAWLMLPSPYSSVVRSPLTHDSLHRVYWTNPGQGALWSTYARIIAGDTPYDLGFTAPDPTYTIIPDPIGGTTTGIPQVVRSYLFTFIDESGAESSPCLPSFPTTGAPDADWQIIGLPNGLGNPLPVAPAGKNFPPVKAIRLYRTITGANAGATYYRVADLTIAEITRDPYSVTPFHDTIRDTDLTGGLTLETAGWQQPPDGLDGLLAMPGGFMVAFKANTLYFSEPNRVHTWPAANDLAVQYDIVGLALWNQTLVILTKGFPSTGTGTSPSSMTLSQVQVPEPCIARGSIITDLLGVYYASQNGIVQLSYYGMQNQTLQTIDKPTWLQRFEPDKGLMACRHRSQYFARKVAGGDAFIIDYSDARLGVVWTDTLRFATSLWNDPYDGETYFLANQHVYRWDSPNTPPMVYRWRSKVFNLIEPINLAACQITIDPSVLQPALSGPGAPELAPFTKLPVGINCLFRLFVGGHQLLELPIAAAPEAVFRLPSGYKTNQFQFEIVSRVPISKVKLATSMKELNDV